MRKFLVLGVGAAVLAGALIAQRKALAEPTDAERSAEQEEQFQRFRQRLQNAKLVGSFTVVGKDQPPSREEYTIRSVKKLPQGDYWLFNARIQYGQRDVTLPLPLEVKWAGATPVITLDNLTIPGLGTFSAHVVIDADKYAGTWTHGETSGHLFGVIEPADAEDAEAAELNDAQPQPAEVN